MIKYVADYDVLSYINLWNMPLLKQIVFYSNPPVYIIDQMQDIGYDTRNVVYAINTFNILINLHFIRCGLVILMHIFLKLTKNKCGGENCKNY